MPALDPLQVYLMTLSIIQPARIQDVEKNVPLMFGRDAIEDIGPERLRLTHEFARKNELVVSVRKGSYCVSRRGASIIRHGKISSQIDNRRLFLMKNQRRGFN